MGPFIDDDVRVPPPVCGRPRPQKRPSVAADCALSTAKLKTHSFRRTQSIQGLLPHHIAAPETGALQCSSPRLQGTTPEVPLPVCGRPRPQKRPSVAADCALSTAKLKTHSFRRTQSIQGLLPHHIAAPETGALQSSSPRLQGTTPEVPLPVCGRPRPQKRPSVAADCAFSTAKLKTHSFRRAQFIHGLLPHHIAAPETGALQCSSPRLQGTTPEVPSPVRGRPRPQKRPSVAADCALSTAKLKTHSFRRTQSIQGLLPHHIAAPETGALQSSSPACRARRQKCLPRCAAVLGRRNVQALRPIAPFPRRS